MKKVQEPPSSKPPATHDPFIAPDKRIIPDIFYFFMKPASMAQLDAPPTGNQEVVGSIPAMSATFFF